ncbi:MAG: hypothetical protein LBC94_09880, partial [Desulfovibrio sp.]|nr:hypothetical protein [Desulfovibrio sp.]
MAGFIAVISMCFLAVSAFPAYSATAERVAVEAGVRAEVNKDLALPYQPGEGLEERVCLDGRPVKDFQGEVAEYWANLECPFCGIREPLLAQRQTPGLCIVVRHIPSREYGESLKKALSYEALKTFSINAANLFWDAVVPKNTLAIPVPYEGSLLSAFQEAAISPEAFTEAVNTNASAIVNADIMAGQSRIFSTPTWVLSGIRFSACDFTAAQLPEALELA